MKVSTFFLPLKTKEVDIITTNKIKLDLFSIKYSSSFCKELGYKSKQLAITIINFTIYFHSFKK